MRNELTIILQHKIISNRPEGTEVPLEQLLRLCEIYPENTLLSQKAASLTAWFGDTQAHLKLCSRTLNLAAKTLDLSAADRAVKGYCAFPHRNWELDEELRRIALRLARRTVEMGKKHHYLPYFQLALGMAEYRSGEYLAANQALAAAEQLGKGNRYVCLPAQFFHAMSLFVQGEKGKAGTLFTEAAKQMKPLPADERQPLAGGAIPDDIIVWLAYKEAKALLRAE